MEHTDKTESSHHADYGWIVRSINLEVYLIRWKPHLEECEHLAGIQEKYLIYGIEWFAKHEKTDWGKRVCIHTETTQI